MAGGIEVIALAEQLTKTAFKWFGDLISCLIKLIRMRQFKTIVEACGIWGDAIIKGANG